MEPEDLWVRDEGQRTDKVYVGLVVRMGWSRIETTGREPTRRERRERGWEVREGCENEGVRWERDGSERRMCVCVREVKEGGENEGRR